jgi:hypothetical protein
LAAANLIDITAAKYAQMVGRPIFKHLFQLWERVLIAADLRSELSGKQTHPTAMLSGESWLA